MPASADPPRQRLLDTHELTAEVLFGLIMVLTFTGSLSIAEAGRDDVRTMLIGALGCNLAWGLIDGILYLMGCLAERGRGLLTLRAVRAATDPAQAQRLIAGALPPLVASVLPPSELEALRQRLLALPPPPTRARVQARDLRGALTVAAYVFLSTLPVALPFVFVREIELAKRLSNLVAVALLFLAGFAYGRSIGRSPWGFGATMVVLGAALVALTMALGG